MNDRASWIMSEGGALICMESDYMVSWGGIDALSVASDVAANDYERTWRALNYIEPLRLREGHALIFGEGPLDTSAWHSDNGQLFLARILACEEDFDLGTVMRALQNNVFADPDETLDFSFATADLVLFDSAERGDEPAKDCLSFSITPGRYKILTQRYDPDPQTWLLLHRFDPIA